MTTQLLPQLMPSWMDAQWLLNQLGDWALWVTLVIVFIECGLLFPILPGDSLLFAVGLFIAAGTIDVPLWLACVLLTIAAFLGTEYDDQERKTRAFDDLMRALASPVATRLAPRIARGFAARKALEEMLLAEVSARAVGEGRDIFSRICQESIAAGETDPEVAVGQMIFLLTAAHDTMSSIATSTVWFLTRHAHWQARLRGEKKGRATAPAPGLAEGRSVAPASPVQSAFRTCT